MANIPDFNYKPDPSIIQAFQNAQQQKLEAQRLKDQEEQQKFNRVLQTTQAVSGMVGSMVQLAEKRKQNDLINKASNLLAKPVPPATITPEGPTMEGQSDTLPPVSNPAFEERNAIAHKLAAQLASKEYGEQLAKSLMPIPSKVTNQAKLFVNDEGKAISVSPDENGLFNVPEGFKEKSIAVADKWTTPRNKANEIRESQFNETQWNKLGKSINALDKGSRTAVGMAAVGNQRAARALVLINNPNMDTVLKKYVEADLAGIMQGGSPHEQMLRQQGYDNLATKWASLKQTILSKPEAIEIPEIRQQLKETIEGIIAVDNDILDTNTGINKESFLKAVQSDPKRFERMVSEVNKIKTINKTNDAGWVDAGNGVKYRVK